MHCVLHREDLAAEVMDVAIYQHHSCVRKLAVEYGGYESNTEVLEFAGMEGDTCALHWLDFTCALMT